MTTTRKVHHILTERLENAYVKTLCGRIVPHWGAIFGTYPDPDYFRHNRPDCQDCLWKHFSNQKGKS
jgi:hypothetical protein